MIFGYARVSTLEQKLDRQMDQLKNQGCERIYQDKITGTDIDRIELNRLLEQLRPGDLIIVTELARLSRSVKDLFKLVDQIHEKQANLKSLKEPWADTTTPYGNLMFTIFAGINQFERDLISIRTKEGLVAAKARGRVGGRPSKQNKHKEMVLILYKSGMKINEICEKTNLSRSTIYRILKDGNNKKTEKKIKKEGYTISLF